MIPLSHVLLLSGILFSLSVAGIFLNRKNVLLILMCIELMLLAVNFNFIAFAQFASLVPSDESIVDKCAVARQVFDHCNGIAALLLHEKQTVTVRDGR